MAKRPKAGRTAYGAAAIRATEMFVPKPLRLFDDPIVVNLLPPLSRFAIRRRWFRESFLRMFERSAPGIRGALLCRTRAIDDAVNAAVARGLGTIIILGPGLDTRACRLPTLTNCSVFELDLPAVQEFKKARLQRHLGVLPRHVRFVPTDFTSDRVETTLAAAGLHSNTPAIFIWEGVTQYLPAAAVDAVLRTIAARPQGSEIIFTYVLEEAITREFRPDRSEAFRKSAVRAPEPWLFGLDPSHLEAFLTERRLSLVEDIGAAEHLARYVRPLGRDLNVAEIERIALARV